MCVFLPQAEIIRESQLDCITYSRVHRQMWDLSGTPSEDIERALKADWEHLIKDERILDSSSYLHEGQRPVIGIWGMGFAERGTNPEMLIRVIKWLRESVAEGVWLLAGTPSV